MRIRLLVLSFGSLAVAACGQGTTNPGTHDDEDAGLLDAGHDAGDADTDTDTDTGTDTGSETDTGIGVCPDLPPDGGFDTPNGGACASVEDCSGVAPQDFDGDGNPDNAGWPGNCLTQEESGYPGGMCVTYWCINSEDADPIFCEAENECVDSGVIGLGYCMQHCDAPADCRRGYSCFDPIDAVGMLRPICMPDCSSDAECNCGEPMHCNPYTGFCEADRGYAKDGEPCVAPEDCESSMCITEGAGFPGGMCVSACSISKNNCPRDPDDGVTSPCRDTVGSTRDMGECFDGCEADSDCRQAEGYRCTPVEGGSVCLPPEV